MSRSVDRLLGRLAAAGVRPSVELDLTPSPARLGRLHPITHTRRHIPTCALLELDLVGVRAAAGGCRLVLPAPYGSHGARLTTGLHLVGWTGMAEPEGWDCSTYALMYRAGRAPGIVLVDSGSGVSYPLMVEALSDSGLPPVNVTHVLLTHRHLDHTGGTHIWQRNGATIVAHAGTARALAHEPARVWHRPEDVHACTVDVPLEQDCILRIGDLAIAVLCTPAHTQDSVSYFTLRDNQALLFTGDFCLPNGQPAYFGSDDFLYHGYLEHLPRMLALAPDSLLTGHGHTMWLGRRWLQASLTGALGWWRTVFADAGRWTAGDEALRRTALGAQETT